VIITSATIDTEIFSKAFGGAPILEIPGRMYPVEVRYHPVEEWFQENENGTYLDATANAVRSLLKESSVGDVLVFLPTERDIIDTRKVLGDLEQRNVRLLPLFGRMSSREQHQIFEALPGRKVILATNIAETSITVPGIRYVVDSGLARISRYDTRSHVLKLPIESISQSSASQRSGRCGRVSAGICIRLYSEKDFLSRPLYSSPEIMRANLASVILRLKMLGLSDIRTFPFIQMPSERSIRAALNLLTDLRALDEQEALTDIGSQLAHMPVDPTIGRILLQAKEEGALPEAVIIAACLSIQDPRERPQEKRERATELHRAFQHPHSDFLSMLQLWQMFSAETSGKPQRQVRQYCTANFLSFIRMREWQDIQTQLWHLIEASKSKTPHVFRGTYQGIHRSILCGFIRNVALKQPDGIFKGPQQTTVSLFPGSALVQAKEAKKLSNSLEGVLLFSGKREWIVCGQWFETTKLFAQTAAWMDPSWLEELAPHLLNRKCVEPGWSREEARVFIREKTYMGGLLVATKKIHFVQIDPVQATELFIRCALVNDELDANLPFIEANRVLIDRVEEWQTRVRDFSSMALEERIYRFFASRLQAVGSLSDLRKWIKHSGGDAGLRMQWEDLVDPELYKATQSAYPSNVRIGEADRPLSYAYAPGEERDGVSLQIPIEDVNRLNPDVLDWAVPGYIREKLETILRALPREIRQKLFPMQERVAELLTLVKPGNGSLDAQVAKYLSEKYQLRIRNLDDLKAGIPEHLKTRIEVVDAQHNPIVSGRSIQEIQDKYESHLRQLSRQVKVDRQSLWDQACMRWEQHNLRDFPVNCPDASIELAHEGGVPIFAFPGLSLEDKQVSLRLFHEVEEARKATIPAFRQLIEYAASRELVWLEGALKKALAPLRTELLGWIDLQTLETDAFRLLCRELTGSVQPYPLIEANFREAVTHVRTQAPVVQIQLLALLRELIKSRDTLSRMKPGYGSFEADIQNLLPADVLRRVTLAQFQEFPRYVKAIQMRNERALLNPVKDQQKAVRVEPYWKKLRILLADPKLKPKQRTLLWQFRWAFEEFKVSIYAQELGTKGKISTQKLDELIAEIQSCR
jgi:ATP-dependent helicase HrpA